MQLETRTDGSVKIDGTVVSAETLDNARAVCGAWGWKADSVETMAFARQLETIKARVYSKKYQELKARQLVGVSNEGGNASEQITYRMWDAYVMARVISNWATDFPLVTASAKEYSVKYKSLGAAYQFSMQDVRNAAKAGTDLEGQLAMGVRRGIEQGLDDILAKGIPEAGSTGLINHPNVPIITLPTGSWSGSTTADQMLADLNYMTQSVIDASSSLWYPDTIVLPTTAFSLAVQKIVGADYNNTVLKAFLSQNPYIKNIDQWYKLNTAAADGGARAMVYKRDDEAMQGEIGQEFEQFPAQQQGLAFTVPCHARAAGVVFRHPLAAAYADNI